MKARAAGLRCMHADSWADDSFFHYFCQLEKRRLVVLMVQDGTNAITADFYPRGEGMYNLALPVGFIMLKGNHYDALWPRGWHKFPMYPDTTEDPTKRRTYQDMTANLPAFEWVHKVDGGMSTGREETISLMPDIRAKFSTSSDLIEKLTLHLLEVQIQHHIWRAEVAEEEAALRLGIYPPTHIIEADDWRDLMGKALPQHAPIAARQEQARVLLNQYAASRNEGLATKTWAPMPFEDIRRRQRAVLTCIQRGKLILDNAKEELSNIVANFSPWPSVEALAGDVQRNMPAALEAASTVAAAAKQAWDTFKESQQQRSLQGAVPAAATPTAAAARGLSAQHPAAAAFGTNQREQAPAGPAMADPATAWYDEFMRKLRPRGKETIQMLLERLRHLELCADEFLRQHSITHFYMRHKGLLQLHNSRVAFNHERNNPDETPQTVLPLLATDLVRGQVKRVMAGLARWPQDAVVRYK